MIERVRLKIGCLRAAKQVIELSFCEMKLLDGPSTGKFNEMMPSHCGSRTWLYEIEKYQGSLASSGMRSGM